MESARTPSRERIQQVLRETFGKDRKVSDLEGGLIRRFVRQCNRYTQTPPATLLEVLALMRHFSAPTRLHDWSYSFHVAVFFALEAATRQCGEPCSVWAINTNWFADRFRARYEALHELVDRDRNFKLRRETFRDVFRQDKPFVCPINPHYQNERLTIQQGIFLCPGSITVPFEDNVAELQYDLDPIFGQHMLVESAEKNLVKIDISTEPETRRTILRELFRMNISNATLFPGLQGFARSLEHALVLPETMQHGPNYYDEFPL